MTATIAADPLLSPWTPPPSGAARPGTRREHKVSDDERAEAERVEEAEQIHYERLCGEMDSLRQEVERLTLELSGERKAKELALAGLESVTELYDAQKHELRTLRERVKALEAAARAVVDGARTSGQGVTLFYPETRKWLGVPEPLVDALAALLSEAAP